MVRPGLAQVIRGLLHQSDYGGGWHATFKKDGWVAYVVYLLQVVTTASEQHKLPIRHFWTLLSWWMGSPILGKWG